MARTTGTPKRDFGPPIETVTDDMVDREYMPKYDRNEEYPAYRAETLIRNETRDNARRYHAVDNPESGIELHDGMARGGSRVSLQSSELDEMASSELESWLVDIAEELRKNGEVSDSERALIFKALSYKLYERMSFDEVAERMSVTKSKVDRWMRKLKEAWFTVHAKRVMCRNYGEADVIRAAFSHKLIQCINSKSADRRRKCTSCGGADFTRTFISIGHNRNLARHTCSGCGRVYTAAEFAKLGIGPLIRRPAQFSSFVAQVKEDQEGGEDG